MPRRHRLVRGRWGRRSWGMSVAPSADPAPPETAIEASLRAVEGMDEIDRAGWDALAGTTRSSATSARPYNPFLNYDFLHSLEEAGCVSRRAGWLPHHVVLEDGAGALLGAAPAYLKSHSQGEYIFDHGWADAFERAGGDYYPKLLTAVPFTPATGPRLLVRDGEMAEGTRAALARALAVVADKSGLSSAHVNFVDRADAAALAEAGWMERIDRQFHWRNDGFASYDDFLATLASRKRKALRKERREALEGNGLTIEWLTGNDLTEEAWDTFFGFYVDTGNRKWGRPYLNRRFFSLLGERMADDVLLIMAKRGDRRIAGALNLIGGDTLYGRHWGCSEHHPFLHFEVCYHQAIDFAIERGLKVVEAGAQGEHKLARGYGPVLTRSMHHISHPGFRRAVEDYLSHERREVALHAVALEDHGPFRRGERTDAAARETLEPLAGSGGFAISHREVEERE